MSSLAAKSVDKGQAARTELPLKNRGSVQPRGAHDAVFSLQSTAGNRAVANLLRRGSGKPLDPATRQEMESKFGEDFGKVRIHRGGEAGTAALLAGARAFTSGQDIAFAEHFYAPGGSAGKRLLAHELAHVVQQSHRNGRVASAASAESEARAAGASVSANGAASVQSSAGSGAQPDPMTDEERRRRNTELMAGPQLMASLRQAGIAPPPAAPPPKLTQIEIQEPGLAADLKKKGIGPPAAPQPQAAAKPFAHQSASEQYPTILRQKPKRKAKEESLEEMEARFFDPNNPSARQNLARVIEGIGGRSFEPEKASYGDLLKEYNRLKSGSSKKRIPNVEDNSPSVVPSTEPRDRRRRTITVRGADFTGLDPTVKETREVWATAEEAEQMEIQAAAEFGGRAATAALGGMAAMGAARSANRSMGAAPYAPHVEMQHGAPLETAPEYVAPQAPRTPSPPPTQTPPVAEPAPVPPAAAPPVVEAAPAPPVPVPKPAAAAPVPAPTPTVAPPPAAPTTAGTATPAPAFWRKAEISATSKIASESAGKAVDLNTVGKSNFAGIDVVSDKEMASVKAYDGPTATTCYINDLQEISGGRGPTGAGSKVSKTVKDIGRLEKSMAKTGGSLTLPAGYKADPAAYVEQNTVLRVPDDHVSQVQDAIVHDLTDPANPYGYQNYGMSAPPTAQQAREFAARRVKGVGMTTKQLNK